MANFDFLGDWAGQGGFGQTWNALQPGGIEGYNKLPWYKNWNLLSAGLGQAAQAVTADDPTHPAHMLGKLSSNLARGNIAAIKNKQMADERKAMQALIGRALGGYMTPQDSKGLTSMSADNKGITIKYTPEKSELQEMEPMFGGETGERPGDILSMDTSSFQPGPSRGSGPNLMGLTYEDILGLQKLEQEQSKAISEQGIDLISAALTDRQRRMLEPYYGAQADYASSLAGKTRAAMSPMNQTLGALEKMAKIEQYLGAAAKSNAEYTRIMRMLDPEIARVVAQTNASNALISLRGSQEFYTDMQAAANIPGLTADKLAAETAKIWHDLRNPDSTKQQAARIQREKFLGNALQFMKQSEGTPEELSWAQSYNMLTDRPHMYVAQPKGTLFGTKWKPVLVNLPKVQTGEGIRQVTGEMIMSDIIDRGLPSDFVLRLYGVSLPEGAKIIDPSKEPGGQSIIGGLASSPTRYNFGGYLPTPGEVLR